MGTTRVERVDCGWGPHVAVTANDTLYLLQADLRWSEARAEASVAANSTRLHDIVAWMLANDVLALAWECDCGCVVEADNVCPRCLDAETVDELMADGYSRADATVEALLGDAK